MRLLEIRKVPITKQISINFKKRLFSTPKKSNNVTSFISDSSDEEVEDDDDLKQNQNEDLDIEQEEMDALRVKLQEILISDRGILDKANRAFVSFIEAYNNHECKYIFKMSTLNHGKIAWNMGLLYLPKIKRIDINDKDFIKRQGANLSEIKYKNKYKERDRQNKIKMIQDRKMNRFKKKEKNKRVNDQKNVISPLEQKKKKQRKKAVGNKKKRKLKIELINGEKVDHKRQKRLSHKLRELVARCTFHGRNKS